VNPDLFLKLSTLGLSHDQMAGVIEVVKGIEAEHVAQVEKGREKVRNRVKKWRETHPVTVRNVTKRSVTTHDAPDLENKQTNKQENKKERASRLPKDWTLPVEWWDEAVAAGLPASRVEIEARKMHNWSLSDRNGAKLDWHATWRNWFLRALESQSKATGPPKPVTLASMWRDEARNLGILNDPPSQSDRRVEARFASGDNSTPGFARRIASTGSG
jgi:hypothetical protein